jgi:hypothetical protein
MKKVEIIKSVLGNCAVSSLPNGSIGLRACAVVGTCPEAQAGTPMLPDFKTRSQGVRIVTKGLQRRGLVTGRRLFTALSVLTILTSLPAHAVKTERWEVKTPAEFMRGKLNRLAVTSDHGLQLGYGATRLGEFAKEVWCSTVAADGTIYFGTGSPADVYAVGGDKQPVKVFETGAIAVTALAGDARGNLYAATLAEGRIFKITPDKKPVGAEFCRLRALYVWALVVDQAGGLFAATGPDGKIFHITPDGQAEEWYATEESNIVSLALDADGGLLAGSGERGLLYRIAEKGRAVVLHEFAEDEVKAIVASGRDLFIGVNKQKIRRPRQPGARRPSAAEFEELTQRLTGQFGTRPPAEPAVRGRETAPEARLGNALAGALYRRTAEGRLDRWAGWDSESILTMMLAGDGALLAGMAGHGRVYRVPDSQRWELLFDLNEQQVLTLATRAGRLAFLGTGNVGAGYLVDDQPAATGDYTSEVHDGKFLTTWGNVLWQGTGTVSVATRSGNTALPDPTWSPWSDPARTSPAKVSSPRGRFIQVRAQLMRASDPRLQSFTLYSQAQNQKPDVTAVDIGEKPKPAAEKPKIEAGGEVKAEGATAEAALAGVLAGAAPKSEDSRPKPATTIKRIFWSASDKDGDSLVYRLFYRAEGDETWLPVFREKPLKKTEYAWDTESVPDGWHRIKIVASDEEANPAGEALTDEKISDLVRVNNRRPEVAQMAWDAVRGALTGAARHPLALIRYLEYSLDGGEWKYFAPLDGVFDDRTETFAVKLALDPGPHTIAVRATDEDGNVGVEKIVVQGK